MAIGRDFLNLLVAAKCYRKSIALLVVNPHGWWGLATVYDKLFKQHRLPIYQECARLCHLCLVEIQKPDVRSFRIPNRVVELMECMARIRHLSSLDMDKAPGSPPLQSLLDAVEATWVEPRRPARSRKPCPFVDPISALALAPCKDRPILPSI